MRETYNSFFEGVQENINEIGDLERLISKVATAKIVICDSILSNPNFEMKLLFLSTTKSTATPIKNTGAISISLFKIQYILDTIIRNFQGFAYLRNLLNE